MENIHRECKDKKISIIIPCRKVNGDTQYCIVCCKYLLNNIEIILVTDKECPGLPADKRNWGMEHAIGDIFAFIDSDAYPHKDWLTNALRFLPFYSAVCGPGVLPFNSSLDEKASDWVYKHLPYSYRVTLQHERIVDEFPTFNLIVWRDRAPKFKPYLTGEDSLFCREIEGQIFYHPSIMVYHRRRPLFRPFWKQVAIYGKHRGHLIRLALLGWITTVFTYAINFIKGFFRRKL